LLLIVLSDLLFYEMMQAERAAVVVYGVYCHYFYDKEGLASQSSTVTHKKGSVTTTTIQHTGTVVA
jgi:hypothetical protein